MTTKNKSFKNKLKEYIKFNIIGISNFIVSQLFYITLYIAFNINYIVSYTITSFLSVTASYFLNSKFTFKQKEYSASKFSLSLLVYVFEYIFNMCIILLLVNVLNISKIIAPLMAPVFSTIPVFLLMRAIIKKNKK